MAFLGGFFDPGKQQQTSSARSGLLDQELRALSPQALGWQQENVAAAKAGMGAPINYALPTLNQSGLTDMEANALASPFQQAVQQALGQQSSQFSLRGFNAPKNLGAIAGSAAMNVAPQFANLMAQLAQANIARQVQAPLTVEQIRQNRYQQFQQALAGVPGLLGTTQSSQGSQMNQGLGFTMGTQLIPALASVKAAGNPGVQ